MVHRTAFITGASSGIGATLARRLAAGGTEVCLAARREPELRDLAERIRAEGGRAHVYPLDVCDPDATEATIQRADDEHGGIDLIVANAGVSTERWAGRLRWEDCRSTVQVNVIGAIATLTAILPRMAERRRGHLVGISSLAQYRGLPKNAVYAASKAFLSTFLEGLRIDLRSVEVAVTDVRPGFVRTPMTAKNEHPMPFMVDCDEAVDRVLEGIERRAPVVAFPWQLASIARSGRLIPAAIYDRVVARARG
jgi:short-subunit dehydrogenase